MTGPNVTLQEADEKALAYVETLLASEGLPSTDVRSSPGRFLVGYDGDERVGVGGLEVYGTDGLLRSLVVEEDVRGDGFGTAVCDGLEARALEAGVERLYLLTTTAPAFFDDRGYVEIERSDVPATIRQTSEFDDLCPTTATCMRLFL